MKQTIQDLVVDAIEPEAEKFRSPILLIHGLFSSSECWSAWLNHFANLGWHAWAIDFKARGAPRALEEWTRKLATLVASLPHPPVLVAHSFGLLAAERAARRAPVAALVGVNPVAAAAAAGRRFRLLALKYGLLLALGRPVRPLERDFSDLLLTAVPAAERARILAGLKAEPAGLIRDCFAALSAAESASPCPTLLIAGSDDRAVPLEAQRLSAILRGAELFEYAGHGHWIIAEPEGERIVRDIHRWIVKALGERLLLAPIPDSGS
jgi:pimeloyl-ACP methyl ester carboxylesterase